MPKWLARDRGADGDGADARVHRRERESAFREASHDEVATVHGLAGATVTAYGSQRQPIDARHEGELVGSLSVGYSVQHAMSGRTAKRAQLVRSAALLHGALYPRASSQRASVLCPRRHGPLSP